VPVCEFGRGDTNRTRADGGDDIRVCRERRVGGSTECLRTRPSSKYRRRPRGGEGESRAWGKFPGGGRLFAPEPQQ
jgi:hypothetical protein